MRKPHQYPYHPSYYISLCSPRAGEGPDYGTLSVSRGFDEFDLLLRIEGEWDEVLPQLVDELLRTHMGEAPSSEEVRRFMHRSGKGWARVTPNDLAEFCGQRELPLGGVT